jgi:hypothetical protein
MRGRSAVYSFLCDSRHKLGLSGDDLQVGAENLKNRAVAKLARPSLSQ